MPTPCHVLFNVSSTLVHVGSLVTNSKASGCVPVLLVVWIQQGSNKDVATLRDSVHSDAPKHTTDAMRVLRNRSSLGATAWLLLAELQPFLPTASMHVS